MQMQKRKTQNWKVDLEGPEDDLIDPNLHMTPEAFRKKVHVWHGLFTVILMFPMKTDWTWIQAMDKELVHWRRFKNEHFKNFRHIGVDMKQMWFQLSPNFSVKDSKPEKSDVVSSKFFLNVSLYK